MHLAPGKDTVSGTLDRLKALADMGFSHAICNLPNVYEITPLGTFGQEIVPAAAAL